MEAVDSKLIEDPAYPIEIVCATEQACKEFVDSGLALEVATTNVLRHGETIVRYNALRQYTLKLVEDYNRIATEHNQKIEKVDK